MHGLERGEGGREGERARDPEGGREREGGREGEGARDPEGGREREGGREGGSYGINVLMCTVTSTRQLEGC